MKTYEKTKWDAPQILVQKFTPNEYVSTCGVTTYGKYLFKCDAPAGDLYYYPNGRGSAKKDWLGNPRGYYGSRSIEADGQYNYHPCSETHEANSTSDFFDGFVDYNENGFEDSGEAVMVWKEHKRWGGISFHATTKLGRDQWTTLKS